MPSVKDRPVRRGPAEPAQAAARQTTVHGTLPQRPAAARRKRGRTAALKGATIAVAAGALAAAAICGGYSIVNATERGHQFLIDWGFEYPGDCG